MWGRQKKELLQHTIILSESEEGGKTSKNPSNRQCARLIRHRKRGHYIERCLPTASKRGQTTLKLTAETKLTNFSFGGQRGPRVRRESATEEMTREGNEINDSFM